MIPRLLNFILSFREKVRSLIINMRGKSRSSTAVTLMKDAKTAIENKSRCFLFASEGYIDSFKNSEKIKKVHIYIARSGDGASTN